MSVIAPVKGTSKARTRQSVRRCVVLVPHVRLTAVSRPDERRLPHRRRRCCQHIQVQRNGGAHLLVRLLCLSRGPLLLLLMKQTRRTMHSLALIIRGAVHHRRGRRPGQLTPIRGERAMARAACAINLARTRGQVHLRCQRRGRCGEHACACARSPVRCRRA